MAKNVLQRHWDGTKFVEIHPVTKALNVFTSDGQSIEQKVTTHLAEKASLTEVGHTQLSNAVDSVDETKAATSKAVKSVKDAIPKLNNTVTSTSMTESATANAVKTVKDSIPKLNDTITSTSKVEVNTTIGSSTSLGTIIGGIFKNETTLELKRGQSNLVSTAMWQVIEFY